MITKLVSAKAHDIGQGGWGVRLPTTAPLRQTILTCKATKTLIHLLLHDSVRLHASSNALLSS